MKERMQGIHDEEMLLAQLRLQPDSKLIRDRLAQDIKWRDSMKDDTLERIIFMQLNEIGKQFEIVKNLIKEYLDARGAKDGIHTRDPAA
jgi:hypothetical protein